MFALVDCNNFYASCERMFNPSLTVNPSSFFPITMDVLLHEATKQKHWV